jgi:phospholipid transport system transporter-binding protein
MPVLSLPSLLTHDRAGVCARTLAVGIRNDMSDTVVIDASALARFDSSALAVLLQCRREAAAIGKNLAIDGLPAKLHELADLYGIESLIQA